MDKKKVVVIGGAVLIIGGILYLFKDKIFKTTKISNVVSDKKEEEDGDEEDTPSVGTAIDTGSDQDVINEEVVKTEEEQVAEDVEKASEENSHTFHEPMQIGSCSNSDGLDDLYRKIISNSAFIIANGSEILPDEISEIKAVLAQRGKDIYEGLYDYYKEEFKGYPTYKETFEKIGGYDGFREKVNKFIEKRSF